MYKFLCCLMSLNVLAQTAVTRFDRIGPEQGLSQSTIWSIAQDAMGVIWIATNRGVNRYDGLGFKVIQRLADDPESLSDNQVRSLYVDSAGYLWASSANGLNRIDPMTGTNRRFFHDPSNPKSLSFSYVYCTAEDVSGSIWVGTREGLNRLNQTHTEFERYLNDPLDPSSISNNTIRDITIDGKGQLWIATLDGLNRYIPESDSFVVYRHDADNERSLSHNQVRALHADAQGQLWVGTTQGLNLLESDGFRRFLTGYENMSDDWINAITHSGPSIWVGTFRGGLLKLDSKTYAVKHFPRTPSPNNGPSDTDITSLFTDRSNLLWIGTFTHGINKLDLNPPKFVIYGTPNSGEIRGVQAIHEDLQRNLYVGTQTGLHRFSHDGKHVHLHEGSQPALSENQILSIASSSSGDIWVGTYSGGLNIVNFDKQSVRHYRFHADQISISSDYIHSILATSSGDMLLGTRAGVDLVSPSLQSIRQVAFPVEKGLGDVARLTNCMLMTQDSKLWVGTEQGVYRLTPEPIKVATELSPNKVICLAEDPVEGIWIGTVHGLARYRVDEPLYTIGIEQGLVGDTIYSIQHEEGQVFWLSTNAGLERLDLNDGHIVIESYDYFDGLQGNDFYDNAAFIRNNGEFLFGGINGLNGFLPNQVIKRSWSPPLVLTSFTVLGNERLLGMTDDISFDLDHLTNQFTMEFAALDYRHPKNLRYQYQLEGYDKQWHHRDEGFATYSHLPYKNYVFHVRATNNDGIWSEKQLSVPVRIRPPFFETKWFRGLMALIVIMSIPAIHALRVRKLRRRNQLMALLVQDKTDELEVTNRKVVDAAHRAGILHIANGVLKQVNRQLQAFSIHALKINERIDDAPLLRLESYLIRLGNWINRPGNNSDDWVLEELDSIRTDFSLNQELIGHEIKDLLERLRDLQETIRIQHHYGMVPLHLEPINLLNVIEDTVSLLRNELDSHQIRIKIQCPAEENCTMSKIKLNQLLSELLKNAIEAMEGVEAEARELKLIVIPQEHEFVLKIADRGPGIPESDIQDVFRYGFSRKPGHAGFGLHNVANIVNELDGSIQIGARPRGGCSVKVTLPRIAGDLAKSRRRGEPRID